MKNALVMVGSVLMFGCGTYAPPPISSNDYAVTEAVEVPDSLFSSDAQLLSDADIERILAYEYNAPDVSRIAILPFGWQSWSGWSDEMALATQDINRKLVGQLTAARRIEHASFLPSILVPQNKSVPHLREAAARYQADLLLVFRSSCSSFSKSRLFRADKIRSYCNVEAVILDVRTGLVPFTSVATRSFDTVKTADDFNLREAKLRSQLDAIAALLDQVSAETVSFLRSR